MKLFTIGDSVSQGFMSLAGARTDLSYSSILARCLDIGNDYRFPVWGADGLPVNIETALRKLEDDNGPDIGGFEWLRAVKSLAKILDATETYYERGPGAELQRYDPPTPFFHNVAVWGFKVADAWGVTPAVCREAIRVEDAEGKGGDGFLAVPSAPMYRSALSVLNPSREQRHEGKSQLGWLEEHHRTSGVDNLLLFLGANNALGTLIELQIRMTPGDGRVAGLRHFAREEERWNLWHPRDFEVEYTQLIEKVDAILDGPRPDGAAPTKVFVGTIPLVTICPLAKGVGPTTTVGNEVLYKYYTYFPLEEGAVRAGAPALTIQDAQFIDRCIRRYNELIVQIVEASNKAHPGRYHVVDICGALSALAWKRNGGKPTYAFPKEFEWLYPPVNTKYYHADRNGRLVQGGIFSLDGVHPTAIGQGLLAHEFLKVMRRAGVVAGDIDWKGIFRSDALYRKPIGLMQEIYEHEKLAEWVIKLVTAHMSAAKTRTLAYELR